MKFFNYLRYFFYIAGNWNVRLAWFSIVHERRGEKKYGINTIGINDLKNLSLKGDNSHSEIYQGSNYFLLEKVFDYLKDNIDGNKNLIDFGCGKGRVLAVAAFYDFNKITGVDFANDLCEDARKNIQPIQKKFPEKIFNIINANATKYKIEEDANVFFFFNPFDEVIMLKVVKNILLSLKQYPREAYVVYENPVHKEIFLSAGFEEIFYFEKLEYIRASIMMINKHD